MANEAERPIEKLLRERARKRREEAAQGLGFELHPATRRMLQGEVTRSFGRRKEAGRGAPWRWVGPFYPRLVQACVLVALMAVVVSVLVPALRTPKEQPQLAKNEEAELGRGVSEPAAALAPPAPAPAAKEEALKKLPESGLVASADRAKSSTDTPALGLEGNRMDKDLLSRAGGASVFDARRSLATGTMAQDKLKIGGTTGLAAATPAQPAAAAAPVTPAESPTTIIVGPATPPAGVAGAPSGSGAMFALAESKSVESFSNGLAVGGGQSAHKYGALQGGTTALPSTTLADSSGRAGSYPDGLKKAEGAGAFQWFAQVPAAGKARTAFQNKVEGPVLAKFQVEQSGHTLKVIDSDGSVYSGYLQTSPPMRTRSAPRVAPSAGPSANAPMREESATVADAVSAGQPVRFFRVTGTNQSLKQKVVFSGTLGSLSNAVVAGNLMTRPQAGVGQAAPPAVVGGSLQNYRITGQVVIGRGKPTELEAVPAPSP